MASVTLKGNTIALGGTLPAVGAKAPDFKLVTQELKEIGLKDFAGKVKVILSVPSLDTAVCARETREFNQLMGSMSNVAVIVASGDLPFAMKRYCAAEGVENVITGSQYRDQNFSKSYGVHITEGGLQGLCARAVFVLDQNDQITHLELVPEIGSEPDYQKALEAVKRLG